MDREIFQKKEIEKLKEKAKNLIPFDLPTDDREYLLSKMNTFSYIVGEVFWNDEFINFSDEQKENIVQTVADGAFQALIKLVKSDMPQKYWDVVIQKITFLLFEKTKVLVAEKLEQGELLEQIRIYTESIYSEVLRDLYQKQ